MKTKEQGNACDGIDRISSEEWWSIIEAKELVDQASKEHDDNLRRVARQRKCYADQMVDPLNGKIVDDNGKVQRLTPDEIASIESTWIAVEQARRREQQLAKAVARSHNTWPTAIRMSDGMIMAVFPESNPTEES